MKEIPDADDDTKVSKISKKYINTSDYNKFSSDTLDAKMKQK